LTFFPLNKIFKWRLWEQGIHPPIRLKYFNDVRFKAINALWQRFYKKWSKKAEKLEKACVIKPVEPRSVQEVGSDKWTIQWQSTAENRLNQEYVSYWQWIRVHEYYNDRNFNEHYERQERRAQKMMNRHHIDRMLIHYNY
jgi:hypothetical protein